MYSDGREEGSFIQLLDLATPNKNEHCLSATANHRYSLSRL